MGLLVGLGIPFVAHAATGSTAGAAYLVPWDGHPDYLDSLYPLQDLYTTLEKLPAKDVPVFLDAYFSGAEGRSVLAKGARPMVLSMENLFLTTDSKLIVLAAARGKQISSDYEKAGHGLFTHAVLTGLQDGAGTDKNGLVTLKDLYPYVKKQVSETAVEELNREQTPVLLPGENILASKRGLQAVSAIAGGPAQIKPSAPMKVQAFSSQTTVAKVSPHTVLQQTSRKIMGQDGAPMILVPAGEFLMGSNNSNSDEKPERRVTLNAFYIDQFEVTTVLYAKFMTTTGRQAPKYWRVSVPVGNGQKPVVGVTWHDADAYCRHYSKRLPTEQEWEKAARGTDGRKYPWGNDEPTSRHANFNQSKSCGGLFSPCDPYRESLHPVGTSEAGASPYGIYDLAGNAWEWTSSDYDGSTKVLRGGSWNYIAWRLRSSYRNFLTPSHSNYSGGFRCAKTP